MRRILGNEDGFSQEGHLFVMLIMCIPVALFLWMVSPVLFGDASWSQLGFVRKLGIFVVGPVIFFPLIFSSIAGLLGGSSWIFSILFPKRCVTLWSAQTGEQLSRFCRPRGDSWIETLSFSSDGKWLAGGGTNHNAYLWSLPDGKLVRKLKGIGHYGWKVFFSANSRKLIRGGGERGIDILDIEEKDIIKRLISDGEQLTTFSISPDRKLLAIGLFGGRVQLLRSHSGDVCREIKLGGWVDCLTFSADGKRLGGAARNHIKVWDIESGKCLCEVSKWRESLKAIALSRDGEILVGGGYGAKIYFWKVATGTEYLMVEEGEEVTMLAASPDGKRIASANKKGKIRIRDMLTGETKTVLNASDIGGPFVWSPNGRIIAGIN